MTSQLDMFAPKPAAQMCGTCIVRNAVDEQQQLGYCTRAAGRRHRDDPACQDWFGLEQLRQPLYGRKS